MEVFWFDVEHQTIVSETSSENFDHSYKESYTMLIIVDI